MNDEEIVANLKLVPVEDLLRFGRRMERELLREGFPIRSAMVAALCDRLERKQ